MDTASVPALDVTRLGPAPGTRMAVVGGCGGIGRGLVAASRAIGLDIAVLDLPKSLDAQPPPNDCLGIPVDATDAASVATAFETLAQSWDRLDVLVNLCGFANAFTPVGDTDQGTWNDVINGNLNAAYLCAHAALPLLQKSVSGSIINTASGLAFKGMPGTAPYGAAKAGVIALSKTLAQECAPDIRVNVIAPGAVDTPFLRGGTGRGGEDEARPANIDLDHYAGITPLKRLAVKDDVVGPILFLAGDAARFITGQVLHINGGGYMP